MRLPMALKVRDGIEKWILRQAFADLLPDYIRQRPKNPMSHSSGLHERARLYKPVFARIHRSFGYDLHQPVRRDFSVLLEPVRQRPGPGDRAGSRAAATTAPASTPGTWPARPSGTRSSAMAGLHSGRPGYSESGSRKLLCGKQPVSPAREPAMPEAVIVATARSPIGRAFKGTMTSIRPDDLTVQMIKAALAKVPQLDPAEIEDLILGCGLPGGEQGYNMARVVAVMLGLDTLPGTTITRYCSSSLQSHQDGLPRDQGGRGRRVHLRRRRVRQPVRPRAAATARPTPRTRSSPTPRRAPQRPGPPRRRVWHDPREDGQIPDIYIAMGQTAENLAQQRGITRAEQDEFGVRSQNLAEKAIADGFWAARHHAGHAA